MPGKFSLADYDTVESRLKQFWDDHPTGAIITALGGVTPDHKSVIVRAEAWFDKADPMPAGVGIAQEYAGGGGANATHHAENCETSSIGRALANCGYSGDLRPSRDEMQKMDRYAQSPPERSGGNSSAPRPTAPAQARPGAAQGEIKPCFKCNLPVRMAFENGKSERYNSDGALHFRS